ncbi:MAG: CrcB family protein [Cyclonatronaceae bacterium]
MIADVILQSIFLFVILMFMAGGAGSVARYFATMVIAGLTDGSAPIATFTVNIAGSFLAGVLGAMASNGYANPEMVLIAGGGFIGGFTTFSTWILQIIVQVEEGDHSGAFYNLSGSLILGTIAAVLGFYLFGFLLLL